MSNDDLRPLVEALRRKCGDLTDRVEQLERENDHLQDRVAELESRTDLSMLSYHEMSRRERVHRLRQYALEQARESNGRAAIKYKEVLAVFDNEPSPGTAYNLMDDAGDADGFEYQDREERDRRLTVDVDAVKASGGLSNLNNASRSTPTA